MAARDDFQGACSVPDPPLSLWVAEGVIGLLDAAFCEPGSCSCSCLPCLGEWCRVVCIWGVVAQGFRPLSWSVAAVACVRFRLCRFSVLMVFRLVTTSVKLWVEHGASIGGAGFSLGCATQGRVVNNDGSGSVCLIRSYKGMGTRGGCTGVRLGACLFPGWWLVWCCACACETCR